MAKVSEIAKRHAVSVSPRASTRTALKLIRDSNSSIVLVLEDDRLVGIASENDLSREGDVRSAMQKPVFVDADASPDSAIRLLMKSGLPMLPVVESSSSMRCIGIVSSSDLLDEKRKRKD